MEQTSSSSFSTTEIVGIATATAAALGGVIVALSRSQERSARKRIKKRARNLADAETAREQLERGRDLALAATTVLASKYPELRSRYPELRGTATEWLSRTTESARPQVSRAGSTAVSTAEQLRERGGTVLERLQVSALPVAQSALHELKDRAGDVVEQTQPKTKTVVSTTTDKADVALTKTTSAAQDALATVMWLITAAMLAYFALLDSERREQVKNLLAATFDQTQLLIRDFQGYEEQV